MLTHTRIYITKLNCMCVLLIIYLKFNLNHLFLFNNIYFFLIIRKNQV